jgi:4-hydroxy-tetrahydrodipicolinate reductase
MKIVICGICGKMGKMLLSCANELQDVEVIAGIDKFASPTAQGLKVFSSFSEYSLNDFPDCIIDFSVKSAIYDILPFAIDKKIPVVLATTGYDTSDLEYIKNSSKFIPIFRSGNMSTGVSALLKLVQLAYSLLGNASDIEIIETHHNQKVDAPSGTALMIAESIKSIESNMALVCGRNGNVGKRKNTEIGMHSVRGGTVVGKHEVQFLMNNEIITIKHEAESKAIFAYGSLRAAKLLLSKPPGEYNMQSL